MSARMGLTVLTFSRAPLARSKPSFPLPAQSGLNRRLCGCKESRKQAFSLHAKSPRHPNFTRLSAGSDRLETARAFRRPRPTEIDPREAQLGDQCHQLRPSTSPRLPSRKGRGFHPQRADHQRQMRRGDGERLYDTSARHQVCEHFGRQPTIESAGWKRGRSMGLLASITTRPAQSGKTSQSLWQLRPRHGDQDEIGLGRFLDSACRDCGSVRVRSSRRVSGPRLFRDRCGDTVSRKRADECGADLARSNDADRHCSLQVGLLIRR